MILPIGDMISVISSRIFRGISPFYPDRRHMHHRIISLGFSHIITVLLIYLINVIVCISLLFRMKIINGSITTFLALISFLTIFLLIRKKQKNKTF